MQQPAPSRKRAAPGASPMTPPQPTAQQQPAFQYSLPDNPDFSNFDFSGAFSADQNFGDQSFATNNNYTSTVNPQQSQAYPASIAPAPSTDLVRRGRNQQLATQNGQQEQWNGAYGTMKGQEEEDERELDLKVQMAKKEAQGKRKQIPPFVQKLSRLVHPDSTRNGSRLTYAQFSGQQQYPTDPLVR